MLKAAGTGAHLFIVITDCAHKAEVVYGPVFRNVSTRDLGVELHISIYSDYQKVIKSSEEVPVYLPLHYGSRIAHPMPHTCGNFIKDPFATYRSYRAKRSLRSVCRSAIKDTEQYHNYLKDVPGDQPLLLRMLGTFPSMPTTNNVG